MSVLARLPYKYGAASLRSSINIALYIKREKKAMVPDTLKQRENPHY
jgi:hypothetical protein